MKYADRNIARLGDEVDFNGGRDKGTVVNICDNVEDATRHGYKEPGLLIQSPRFGFAFYGANDLEDDGMILIRRKKR